MRARVVPIYRVCLLRRLRVALAEQRDRVLGYPWRKYARSFLLTRLDSTRRDDARQRRRVAKGKYRKSIVRARCDDRSRGAARVIHGSTIGALFAGPVRSFSLVTTDRRHVRRFLRRSSCGAVHVPINACLCVQVRRRRTPTCAQPPLRAV